MNRKKTYVERLAEIAKEYEEPLRGLDYFRSRLGWEDWVGLRREGVEYAREEIRKRKWRGSWGGVLPGCSEAEDIVAHAIAVMFEGKARLAAGFTRERVKKELERLIDLRVTQLRRRKEAPAVRSEWDVLQAGENGTPVSVLPWIVDERAGEPSAEREQEEALLKERVEEKLRGEPELLAVFGCRWSGMKSAAEIGQKLGMEAGAVRNAQKRLERRLAELRREIAGA